MYKVYCDSYLLYDENVESLTIVNPKISTELNAIGSFEFSIYPNHPYYDVISRLESIIEVYEDNLIIFKGRVLSDDIGFYNERKVVCESDMAYLLDSVQRPYEFPFDENHTTPKDLFEYFINEHNAQVSDAQKFIIGNCTVVDPNGYLSRSDSTYLSTFESLQQKLIDGLGGYLWVRHEADGNYIDYVADFPLLSSQKIEFAENLLDINKKIDASEIFTVIIPLGAEIQDEEGNSQGRLDIKSVNGGLDYLENTDAISKYGRIVRMVEWDDVTIASNLKTKARQYLDANVLMANTIELSAVDLSPISDVSAFHLGTKVKVTSKPHGIDDYYLVDKLSIDLMNPSNNKISLGKSYKSLTESQKSNIQNLTTEVSKRIDSSRIDITNQITKQYNSSIESTSQSILSTVSENYYTKGDADDLIGSVSTQLEQTSEGWNFTFNNFQTDYNANQENTDKTFEEWRKYIRFKDGNIILCEEGNELELQIANDRIKFLQHNTEVAYFSNNKLYVVDGEFTNSLQLGDFAFLPRTNGNLSFKKVR